MTIRQRTPRLLDPAFLDFIRTKPCCICGQQAEAAHIRMASIERGKNHSGIGQRPDDKWSTPLCPDHHRNGKQSQHEIGSERKFWQSHGLDPFVIAETLFAEFALIRKTPPPEPVLIRKRKARIKHKEHSASKIKASRPIQNRSSWPPKGSRPFPSRRL